MREMSDCSVFDGFVSPTDIRDGEKVWGSHGFVVPSYWTGRALNVVDGQRMLLWMDCAEVAVPEPRFWVIDINSDCSWHYHKP